MSEQPYFILVPIVVIVAAFLVFGTSARPAATPKKTAAVACTEKGGKLIWIPQTGKICFRQDAIIEVGE